MEAWEFWKSYGGNIGLEVRKRYANKRKSDGKVRSFRYVCSKEVRIGLILDQKVGNYEVTDLVLDHNHILYPPETFHLMSSEMNISDLQAFEIKTINR
ncbi:hypothetical protein DAI22_06g161203 [Oryza sativa Japonica Group]|nr:hypothetical protein DAI22_06g161203 [Oryza sativa Japonica Group]